LESFDFLSQPADFRSAGWNFVGERSRPLHDLQGMMASDEALRQILFSIFRRKGAEGATTKLADSDYWSTNGARLPDVLEVGELPVVHVSDEQAVQCLITTRRLLFLNRTDPAQVRFEEIKRVGPVLQGAVSLRSVNKLRIDLVDGRHVHLFVDPGRPLISVQSILLNRIRFTRRRASAH
jgi:hypothetical protein